MSRAAPIVTHPRAGRVEPARLAVRVREPSSDATSEAPAPLAGEARLGDGSARIGPLEVRVVAREERGAATLDLAVRNAADRPVHCESAVLGLRWSGLGGEPLRWLRHGWQSWSCTEAHALDAAGDPAFPSGPWLRGIHHALGTPPADRAGWHESELLTVVGRTPGGAATCVGVLERGRAFGVLFVRREPDAVRIEVELWLDALLGPSESRELDRVRIALGEDASALLEAHAEAHGRLAGARIAHPFVSGWSTWYHFFHRVTEADVLRNLEALSSAREALPVEVVQIDDGWQRRVGDWLETSAAFPRGLAPLAREIRAAGFVPGLWTAPFCAVPESAVAREHPEWLLRRGGAPLLACLHGVWSPDGRVLVLDASRDDVRAHLRELFARLASLGFAYLKLDFLYAAAMAAASADPRVGRAERLRRGLEAIRAGAGEEAFLLGCGCPLGAAVGIVDGMRIGPDVAPQWLPEPPLVPGGEATLPSTRSAVRSILARAFMHRRLWLNDPDCLMARNRDTRLSRDEARTLAAAIAASGGLALFSDDVAALDAPARALVRDTLALARRVDALGIPGRARALGLLEGELPLGLLASGACASFAALVNAGDAPARLALPADALAAAGAPPEALLGSRELRPTSPCGEGGARGADGRAGSVALGPHESALYRIPRAVRIAVFCDFDGTFSVQDVGATLAQRLAGHRRPKVWARYERGEITAWEYNLEILDRLPLPLADLEAFLRTIELDRGARALVEWCEAQGVPFRVLSDGFDFNLNRIQVLHAIRFAYDANRLRYESGVWRIAAGHPNPACRCGTGTCKRGRIEAFRRGTPGATLVHIGNGRVSDLCGALAADVVFAKDSLATELARREVPFQRFETLLDVIPGLERLLGTPPESGSVGSGS
jgi:alpha-galactosidase